MMYDGRCKATSSSSCHATCKKKLNIAPFHRSVSEMQPAMRCTSDPSPKTGSHTNPSGPLSHTLSHSLVTLPPPTIQSPTPPRPFHLPPHSHTQSRHACPSGHFLVSLLSPSPSASRCRHLSLSSTSTTASGAKPAMPSSLYVPILVAGMLITVHTPSSSQYI